MSTFVEKVKKFHENYVLIESIPATNDYELKALPFDNEIKELDDFLSLSEYEPKDSIPTGDDSKYTIKRRENSELIKEDIDKNQLDNFINDL